MVPSCRIRAALAGLLLAASPAAAQSASDRLALNRFRDSLDAVADTAALARAYRVLERSRAPGDPGLRDLRLGLVALRLAEAGVGADAGEARARFRRVTEREPGWPWGWYGLGLAEALRSLWEQEDRLALGSRVGLGTVERACDRHRRALDSDPAFVPAALALAELTLGLRDTARYAPARDAVRRAAERASGPTPELFLAWGRLERAAGETGRAMNAFRRYIAAGGSRALGRLEIARTSLAAGEAHAEGDYFAAAAEMDSLARAGYRADLAPIATEVELARFDALSGPERTAWLRRFWHERDRYEMRAEGERLREHYRRLLHARRAFALTVSRRFYGRDDAYRSGSEELDDRGIIYVRHGEPSARLRPFVFGLMPNESWRYRRAEGDLLFHFSAGYDDRGGGDLHDYRLVSSVLDLRGAADAPRDQLMLSRQSLSPMYGRMLNWGPYGSARARARERGIGDASIAIGTATDSYELSFERGLPVLADLIAVGERGGLPLAHLVVAVAADGLRAGEPLRIRLVGLDEGGRPVASADTSIAVGRPGRERGRWLLGRVEVPLSAGTYTWRAAVQQGDSAGTVLPLDSVRVADRGGPAVLSDLALGARSASTAWEPVPGDTVLLTPFDLFRAGAEAELYYELAGATPGASYRHEIAVYRVKGDDDGEVERRPVVSLGFDEPARAALVRSHRTLQLARLKPGRYVVEVRLRGAGAESEARRRAFSIVRADRR
ncbi:MAG TPA: GWxTD domain-containing protein [Gemmatimonadales bacterium]|nr:GWxTD domain-containing protein [Gemmatimonadales bacterium]